MAFVDLVSIEANICQIRIFATDGDLVSSIDKNVSTAKGQGIYETQKVNLFQNDVEVV